MNERMSSWTRGHVMQAMSPQVQEMVEVGRSRHWEFKPMCRAPLPERPIFYNEWWLVPAEQDNSLIPVRAYERIQALYAAGVRPKGFVIAHEAPPLLAAPEEATLPKKPLVDWTQVWRFLRTRVVGPLTNVDRWAALVPALLIVLKALAIGFGALVMLPIALITGLGALVLVDPVLVAVTEDDCWVEIDRWWT